MGEIQFISVIGNKQAKSREDLQKEEASMRKIDVEKEVDL